MSAASQTIQAGYDYANGDYQFFYPAGSVVGKQMLQRGIDFE